MTADRIDPRGGDAEDVEDHAASRDAPPTAAETLFETASAAERDSLQVELDGYSGPLDLLLDLARRKKIDLKPMSMLALAEQYLIFFERARAARLDMAADYLVMAAWLAYLKSRQLLPEPPSDDEPSGEDMAAYLAFQLERLQALQGAIEELFARPRLGETFFPRGEPEKRVVSTKIEWTATQHELLLAYARQRMKASFTPLHLDRRAVVAIDQALARLRAALGPTPGWERLAAYLPEEWREEASVRSALASTFAAALELAKHGQIELRQDAAFAPIYISRRADAPSQETIVRPAPIDAEDEEITR